MVLKYKKQYCKEIIEFMSKGYSIVAFAGEIGVGKQTIYDWIAKYPEFAAAHKTAMARCQGYWEKVGMEGMYMGGKDNPFQSSMWNFNMSARFGWSQKKEQSVKVASLQDLVTKSFDDDKEEE